MTTASDTHTPEMRLNHEKVWSVVQKIAKQIKETNAEIARQMRETDRRMEELSAETDRQMKETNEQIGRWVTGSKSWRWPGPLFTQR